MPRWPSVRTCPSGLDDLRPPLERSGWLRRLHDLCSDPKAPYYGTYLAPDNDEASAPERSPSATPATRRSVVMPASVERSSGAVIGSRAGRAERRLVAGPGVAMSTRLPRT